MQRKILITVLGLILFSTFAAAGPIYFGISAGKSSVEEKNAGFKFSDDDRGTKYYAGFGVLKFLRIEGTYDRLGSFSGESGGVKAESDIRSYGAAALGVLPLGKHFEIFARAGAHYWSVDTTLSGAVSDTTSKTGTSMTYGAGASVLIFKNLALRAEYEQFKTGETDSLKLTSFGAEFRF